MAEYHLFNYLVINTPSGGLEWLWRQDQTAYDVGDEGEMYKMYNLIVIRHCVSTISIIGSNSISIDTISSGIGCKYYVWSAPKLNNYKSW